MGIQENLQKQKDVWSQVTWEDMASYIGPNADYYKPSFDRLHKPMAESGKAGGFKLEWHWGAFIPILGIPWAAARKQWGIVAIMAGTVVLTNILTILFDLPPSTFGFMIFMVPAMMKGIFLGSAVTQVVKIKQAIPDGPARQAAIREAGGFNMTYGLIAGGICLGLLALSVWSLATCGMDCA